MKWCEHIKSWHEGQLVKQSNVFWFKLLDGGIVPANDWFQCPICGAKRPEEPKTLAERIKAVDHSYGCGTTWLNDDLVEGIVSLVREYALEEYNNWDNDENGVRYVLFCDQIKSWR